jgi:mannose-6-phosphate isomerase-like protein (cupin superfamily)
MMHKSGRVWSREEMEARIVRYAALRPCYNAFVDTRTPGSEAKENFTIIGPGVSENPEQHVHIAEPHGFNIGGARQPPGCVNSQHSHETAEVFVVHSGSWRFDLGEHGQDAQVELGPGDVISLPIRTFRGFTNVGDDLGFLWAVLGGDDPGRVTWAPHVFDMARDYGLVLLESGRLIDTTRGETVTAGERPMPPTTAAQAAAMRKVSPEEAERHVARYRAAPGVVPVIGAGAPLGGGHGFTLERLELEVGDSLAGGGRDVLFVHRGAIRLLWPTGETRLGMGDTLTFPPAVDCSVRALEPATLFRVRREDLS